MCETPDNDAKQKHPRLALTGVWAVALGWVYYPVAKATVEGFLNPANDMAYGWFVLPVAVCMMLFMRKKLSASAGRPAWGGLVWLLCSFVLHGFGQHSGQLFVSQLAMLFAIPAVAWTGWGWKVARLLLFPTAYLLLVIPLHLPVLNAESLGWFSGVVSSGVLNGLGVETVLLNGFNESVMSEGVFLYSPGGHFQFQVADVCSGMRSLSALTVFTAAHGFFIYKTGLRIFILLAVSVPFVVCANIVRIILLCLIALLWGQEAASSFLHEAPGLILFYATIIFLLRLGDKFISQVGTLPPNPFQAPPARQLGWRTGTLILVLGIILTVGVACLTRIQSW